MNVYDFDQTIYRHDSTVDFIIYCLKRYPGVWRHVPNMAVAGMLYRCKRIDKTEMKQRIYRFLTALPDVEAIVCTFWDDHLDGIQGWYRVQMRPDDVIISASPFFLVQEACQRLGINRVLASNVDPRNGMTQGLNCHGEEKVRRFAASPWYGEIDAFYSDSRSDAPLARLAQRAYLVRRGSIEPWPGQDWRK